jgi:hypothetical protein
MVREVPIRLDLTAWAAVHAIGVPGADSQWQVWARSFRQRGADQRLLVADTSPKGITTRQPTMRRIADIERALPNEDNVVKGPHVGRRTPVARRYGRLQARAWKAGSRSGSETLAPFNLETAVDRLNPMANRYEH